MRGGFDSAGYARALDAPEDAARPGLDGASAGAFLLRDGRLLLERRPATARLAPGRLDSPGGKAEPGERPADALRRELREELGIEVRACRLVGFLDERVPARGTAARGAAAATVTATEVWRHFHFVLEAWDGEPAPREGQVLEWHAPQEALARPDLHPLTALALRALLAQGGARSSG
jgi:8-oxo-dGTP diphosphatase